MTTILSKHHTCIHHVYVHENACTQEDRFIKKLSYYLPEDFHILWPKRLRAESTHPENWPKRPTYQGRNDPPPNLAETTQAETTQAETTQGRNDPDSPLRTSGNIKFSRGRTPEPPLREVGAPSRALSQLVPSALVKRI